MQGRHDVPPRMSLYGPELAVSLSLPTVAGVAARSRVKCIPGSYANLNAVFPRLAVHHIRHRALADMNIANVIITALSRWYQFLHPNNCYDCVLVLGLRSPEPRCDSERPVVKSRRTVAASERPMWPSVDAISGCVDRQVKRRGPWRRAGKAWLSSNSHHKCPAFCLSSAMLFCTKVVTIICGTLRLAWTTHSVPGRCRSLTMPRRARPMFCAPTTRGNDTYLRRRFATIGRNWKPR